MCCVRLLLEFADSTPRNGGGFVSLNAAEARRHQHQSKKHTKHNAGDKDNNNNGVDDDDDDDGGDNAYTPEDYAALEASVSSGSSSSRQKQRGSTSQRHLATDRRSQIPSADGFVSSSASITSSRVTGVSGWSTVAWDLLFRCLVRTVFTDMVLFVPSSFDSALLSTCVGQLLAVIFGLARIRTGLC
jgi:hypothetical protein